MTVRNGINYIEADDIEASGRKAHRARHEREDATRERTACCGMLDCICEIRRNVAAMSDTSPTPLPKCACWNCLHGHKDVCSITRDVDVMKQADPNGLAIGQPGAKLDAGKPDASLLLDFGLALMAVAEVATFGHRVKGYARGGWLQVPDGPQRYAAAQLRHMLATETHDPESGLLHAKHEAWNSLAKLELLLRSAV